AGGERDGGTSPNRSGISRSRSAFLDVMPPPAKSTHVLRAQVAEHLLPPCELRLREFRLHRRGTAIQIDGNDAVGCKPFSQSVSSVLSFFISPTIQSRGSFQMLPAGKIVVGPSRLSVGKAMLRFGAALISVRRDG